MRDLNIVIPAKDPARAKERLAPILTAEQRSRLALMLFDRVLRIFKGLSQQYHILVVTDSDRMEERAARQSVTVLRETEATGETQAVEMATAWSVANGFRSQMVVPADMPNLSPADLATLLNTPRENPSVILCPATGDDGTNAIVTTPPHVIPFRFGQRSFPDYRTRAAERQVPCRVVRLSSLVLDLDTPEDLALFLADNVDHPVRNLLATWNVHRKLV